MFIKILLFFDEKHYSGFFLIYTFKKSIISLQKRALTSRDRKSISRKNMLVKRNICIHINFFINIYKFL